MAKDSSPLELIVGHSHSHADHTAGDSEMRALSMPNVTVRFIAPNLPSVIAGYSIASWPDSIGTMDLGARILDIVPIPGHTDDAIAVYDRETGLLLTGDSVYPGRLYIPKTNLNMFKESHSRLLKTVKSRDWTVSWVLGCHIEQKQTPFEDYPMGTEYQPHEHVLQFNVSILDEIEIALQGLIEDPAPGQYRFPEFSLVIRDALPNDHPTQDQRPLTMEQI